MARGRRWCGYRLVAIEAYRDGTGPGTAGHRNLDDYADQVCAVAEPVGGSVRLVGFSWGGATSLRVTAAAPELVDSQTSDIDHAICDTVRRHVPQARHALIEGAGHMMPLTHPSRSPARSLPRSNAERPRPLVLISNRRGDLRIDAAPWLRQPLTADLRGRAASTTERGMSNACPARISRKSDPNTTRSTCA